jgi:hypothetical protein
MPPYRPSHEADASAGIRIRTCTVLYTQAFLPTNYVELILLNVNSDWASKRNRNDLRRVNHRSAASMYVVVWLPLLPHNPKIPKQATISDTLVYMLLAHKTDRTHSACAYAMIVDEP